MGNKADLSQDRKVTTEEAKQWARENDVSVCVESSAKSGDGVEDAFQRVAEEVFRKIRDGVFDLTDKVLSQFTWCVDDIVYWDQSQSTQELGTDKSGDEGTEEARIWMLLMLDVRYRDFFFERDLFPGVGLKKVVGFIFF